MRSRFDGVGMKRLQEHCHPDFRARMEASDLTVFIRRMTTVRHSEDKLIAIIEDLFDEKGVMVATASSSTTAPSFG